MYAAHILKPTRDETPRLEDYQVLQVFKDVFLDDIPVLPPKSDIDFTIELVPGAAPVSKTPYRMSTPVGAGPCSYRKGCYIGTRKSKETVP